MMKKIIPFIIFIVVIIAVIFAYMFMMDKPKSSSVQNSNELQMEVLPFDTNDNLDQAIEELQYIE